MAGNGIQKRALVAFCCGVGASDAWWLCASTAAVGPAVGEVAWYSSLILHGASVLVQLLCLVSAASIGPWLGKRRGPLVLGSAVAVFSAGAMLASSAALPWGWSAACLALAAAANALIFLGWMRRLCSFSQKGLSSLSLLLVTMACGALLWLLINGAPAAVMAGAAVILPLVSGILLGMSLWREVPARHLGEASGIGTRRTGVGNGTGWGAIGDGGGLQASGRRQSGVFLLLSPLFLGGVFVYELAPGMVTSLAHINGMVDVYVWYAGGILLLAVLGWLLQRWARFASVVFRLVAPVISLGLIALALVAVQDGSLAMAATLVGSMLFEAFLLARFADVATGRGVEPVSVFALGGLAMQLGILVAYGLVPVLAESAQITIAAIALVIVFLLVLTGAFFGGEPDGVASGSPLQGASGEEAAAAASVSPAELQHRECAVFAERHRLSKRESEVFELAMQGKNQVTIAKELFVAETTVKTHLRSIYRKTGVANRQELIALFRSYNLL